MPDILVRPDGVGDTTRLGKPSGRRGRRRGVEVKPGTVKQARMEAGLSLGQVARGDISRTAIYFVETGKAKPSIETLKLIAERTGRPLDYFLKSPLVERPQSSMIAELERLIVTEDNVGAAALGETALGQGLDPETAARIKFHMSMAYLRLGQPVVARRLASAARAYFDQVGDLLMTAECLGNEASAAFVLEQPEAARLAEAALAACRSITPVPAVTESRLLMVLGSVHATNQDWEAAIDTYREAIAAADVVQDLHRLSLLYSGLSLAHQELGQYDEAGRLAQRALNIHQTLNDRLSLARSENNPNVFLSLAELAVVRHDLTEAERLSREACDLSARLNEFATLADAHFWLAKVAEARGDDQTVDEEFVATFEALGHEPGKGRAARYHAVYAEILEARGDLAGANRQLKLALSFPPPGFRQDSQAAIG